MLDLLVNHRLSDAQRRVALFDGTLLLYTRTAGTAFLARHARAMIADAFEPLSPERAQFSLPVAEFAAIVGPLKTRFTNDPQTHALVEDILDDFGCDDDTRFDVPRLRVAPHGRYLTAGVAYAYPPHRDTWYASPACQINWWLPVFPVVPAAAMIVYPEHFDVAVPNTSADFDYGEWCAVGRPAATSQIDHDARRHPGALEPGAITGGVRIGADSGDLLMFSAQHLHATSPNTSGATRFSIDFRTVAWRDLDTGAGAPNVDGAATGSTLSDFRSLAGVR